MRVTNNISRIDLCHCFMINKEIFKILRFIAKRTIQDSEKRIKTQLISALFNQEVIVIQIKINQKPAKLKMQDLNIEKRISSQNSSQRLQELRRDSSVSLTNIGVDQDISVHSTKQQDQDSDNNQDPQIVPALSKRGRKAKYDGAEHPDLIDKAKLILPIHNYDISKILELEEFKPLIGSRDLTKFVSKFILNKTTQSYAKSVKDHKSKDLNEIQSQIKVKLKAQCADQILKQDKDILDERIDNHNSQVNYGAKIQSEITSHYIREFMILKPHERQDFIWKIFNRNSQSLLEFLQNLKSACQENLYEDMFRNIYELNQRAQVSLQIKTRLFLSSLLYY